MQPWAHWLFSSSSRWRCSGKIVGIAEQDDLVHDFGALLLDALGRFSHPWVFSSLRHGSGLPFATDRRTRPGRPSFSHVVVFRGGLFNVPSCPSTHAIGGEAELADVLPAGGTLHVGVAGDAFVGRARRDGRAR